MKKKMRALILYFQIFNLIPIVLYIQKTDIKFTLKKKEAKPEEPKVEVETEEVGEVEITRTEKAAASKSKEKPVAVEPLSPEELKQILSQSKENEDDDCLMCGS